MYGVGHNRAFIPISSWLMMRRLCCLIMTFRLATCPELMGVVSSLVRFKFAYMKHAQANWTVKALRRNTLLFSFTEPILT